MKKLYNKPSIDIAELHLHAGIMSRVGDNGEQPTTDPGTTTPDRPAPGRKVF